MASNLGVVALFHYLHYFVEFGTFVGHLFKSDEVNAVLCATEIKYSSESIFWLHMICVDSFRDN